MVKTKFDDLAMSEREQRVWDEPVALEEAAPFGEVW